MRIAPIGYCLLLLTLPLGCSTGDGGNREGDEVTASAPSGDARTDVGSAVRLADESELLSSAVTGPSPVTSLSAERIAALPPLADTSAIVVDSGLQVAWTPAATPSEDVAPFIGVQWQSMQGCIGQVAPAPLVVLVDGVIVPISAADDVIRDIDGQVRATSNAGSVAILQVHPDDLAEAVVNRGFTLRSIMGRHLWLSANLPERDYPYRCARNPSAI